MPVVDQAQPRVPPYSAHLETALFDAMQALSRAGHAAHVIGRDAAALRLAVALEAVRGLLTEEQRARPPAPEHVQQPSDWAGARVSVVGGDFDGARVETLARDLVMALQTNGAPGVLVSEAQSVLVNARARRLAGTTPIDAPPAKEP